MRGLTDTERDILERSLGPFACGQHHLNYNRRPFTPERQKAYEALVARGLCVEFQCPQFENLHHPNGTALGKYVLALDAMVRTLDFQRAG
jgi:hypothetical protein